MPVFYLFAFYGELRLAIALLAMVGRTQEISLLLGEYCVPCCLRFLNLPAALILGRIIKMSLPVRKV
jgi:hypothetical protein